MAYDFARHRVTLCKDGLPERTVWLVIKRTRSPEPTYAYAISNAPASTPFRTLVWLSGIRWAVEQCFEEGKTELGMAHYEVRKYAGWQHHMLLTMLAHFFLWHLKGRLGKKSASADGVAAPPVIRSRVTPACVYDSSTPSIVYVRRGKTTSNNVRSCDTVRAGAFFPQAQLQVPQKEMRQHRRQHMVVPAGIFAHFIVVHPQLGFAFFKALLNRPAHATEPDKGAQGRARRGITDVVRIRRGQPPTSA